VRLLALVLVLEVKLVRLVVAFRSVLPAPASFSVPVPGWRFMIRWLVLSGTRILQNTPCQQEIMTLSRRTSNPEHRKILA
jgi:hypothetical protein